MRAPSFILATLIALALLPAAARATECRLERVASVDLTTTTDDHVIMKVAIAGEDHSFMLDTAGIISTLRLSVSDKLHPPKRHTSGVYDGTTELGVAAILPEIELGGLKGTQQAFYVVPEESLPDGIDGVIGLDKLAAYDIELDLAHDKLNLFSQDHCKGQVVYWTDNAVIVPFEVQSRSLQFEVPMTLDAKPVSVLLDTALPESEMTFATLHRLFAITRTGMEQPADRSANSRTYRYPLKSLRVGGLTINNPDIRIRDFGDEERVCDGEDHDDAQGHYYRCFGGGDLRLGLKQLRALRVFIAFSEKTLYVTAAGAH